MFDPISFASRFWPTFRCGTRRSRSGLIVWASLWVLLRLPVAVPDFHEVAHHHSDGVDCLYHEHLNRWHRPVETGESAAGHEREMATLHWHWVIPGSNLPEGQSAPSDSNDTFLVGPQLTQGSGGDILSQVLESARAIATIDRTGSERSELLDLAGACLLSCVRWLEDSPRCAQRVSVAQVIAVSLSASDLSRPLRC
ncbi:hypothetical protein GC170_05810 [bacterium]|nr:hypothetical protein [bacterium]